VSEEWRKVGKLKSTVYEKCRMWKFTTYSALVRWTLIANGSKG